MHSIAIAFRYALPLTLSAFDMMLDSVSRDTTAITVSFIEQSDFTTEDNGKSEFSGTENWYFI